MNSCGDSFFGYLEHCAAHNRTVDELNNTQWNQWLAETCIDVLQLILAHYKKYREVMNDNSIKPSSTAFASMQRIVNVLQKKSEIFSLMKICQYMDLTIKEKKN